MITITGSRVPVFSAYPLFFPHKLKANSLADLSAVEDHPIDGHLIEVDEPLSLKPVEITLNPVLIAKAVVAKVRGAAHQTLRVGTAQRQTLKAVNLLGRTDP